jgi:acetyl esterase/lipase
MLSGLVTGVGEHAVPSTSVPAQIDPGPSLETSELAHGSSQRAGPLKRSPDVSWTVMRNVAFPTVDGQSELLDVYLPDTPVPVDGRPVMVAVHGGGWRRFNKTGYGERIASGFVKYGYAVVAPDYQLSEPGLPSWPINFEDVQAAVSWVRDQAASLDFNPSEITAIGESAGANLAALLGTSSAQSTGGGNSAVVNAVVAFSTPTDLTSLYHESPSAGLAAAQFLGGTPEQVPEDYVAASPLDHVAADDPPMLLVHGLEDPLIPVSQSEEMARALTAAGVRNELILVRGGHKLDFPVRYSNLFPEILEFLQTTWKDE